MEQTAICDVKDRPTENHQTEIIIQFVSSHRAGSGFSYTHCTVLLSLWISCRYFEIRCCWPELLSFCFCERWYMSFWESLAINLLRLLELRMCCYNHVSDLLLMMVWERFAMIAFHVVLLSRLPQTNLYTVWTHTLNVGCRHWTRL